MGEHRLRPESVDLEIDSQEAPRSHVRDEEGNGQQRAAEEVVRIDGDLDLGDLRLAGARSVRDTAVSGRGTRQGHR